MYTKCPFKFKFVHGKYRPCCFKTLYPFKGKVEAVFDTQIFKSVDPTMIFNINFNNPYFSSYLIIK